MGTFSLFQHVIGWIEPAMCSHLFQDWTFPKKVTSNKISWTNPRASFIVLSYIHVKNSLPNWNCNLKNLKLTFLVYLTSFGWIIVQLHTSICGLYYKVFLLLKTKFDIGKWKKMYKIRHKVTLFDEMRKGILLKVQNSARIPKIITEGTWIQLIFKENIK